MDKQIQPGLIQKVCFFGTDDGLWWRLGTIIAEEWRMTADGEQWCFQLENGHWLRDLRQNPKFHAIDASIASPDPIFDLEQEK